MMGNQNTNFKNPLASAVGVCQYYRDSNMNEIDLMIEHEGLTLVECKSGTVCEKSDVKSFKAMKGSGIVFENAYVICLTGKAYPVDDGVYALPVSSI